MRYTTVITVIVGFCALLALGVWYFSTPTITNYPPKNKTIVAFGDSLVFGYGATTGRDFVSVLGQKIGRTIINLGISGNTTADGVARMSAVQAHEPGTVILLLGGNDTLRNIPRVDTEKNLRILIEQFLSDGSVVVLVGVRGGALIDDREDLYEDLSKEYGLVYLPDVLDGVFLKPELMHDAIHPNDAGYAKIADRLYVVLTEAKLI